jgi:hypothetical protein
LLLLLLRLLLRLLLLLQPPCFCKAKKRPPRIVGLPLMNISQRSDIAVHHFSAIRKS